MPRTTMTPSRDARDYFMLYSVERSSRRSSASLFVLLSHTHVTLLRAYARFALHAAAANARYSLRRAERVYAPLPSSEKSAYALPALRECACYVPAACCYALS